MTVERPYTRAPLAHLEVDLDGVVCRANDACADVLNRAAKDLVGKAFVGLFPSGPDGRERAERILEARGTDGDEIELAHGDGLERWGSIFAWTVRDTEMAVQKLQVVLVDVTEQRRLRLELLESEARFRTLGDSAPVLLWMSGRDAKCMFFNQRWLEFTGRTLEMEMGDGWAEGVHPEDFQGCMDAYLTAFVRRQGFRTEYRLRRSDGQYRWILDTGLPRHLPDGTFAGFIGSCIDITDFRDANDHLRQVQFELEGRVKEARAAIEARNEFLSIASHELRTPLSALILQLAGLQRLLRQASMNGKFVAKIERAIKTTDRLTTLIENLLDVSRIATGRLQLQVGEYDLAEIVRSVGERWADAATRVGSELRLHVGAPVQGTWDRLRLEQILENLLSNALKYGPGKSVEVTVTAAGGVAILSVRDHGIGISQQDALRIFERFERAVPARHYGGLGLGLYIARQVAEAHGGSIRVTSELGAGATFEVELPRQPPPKPAQERRLPGPVPSRDIR